MTEDKPKRPQQVFTLVVEVGRKAGDGLPDKATGAALMCYASGVDEAEAVRETVALLKAADLAPLDVSGYGTLDDRLAGGDEIDEDDVPEITLQGGETIRQAGADVEGADRVLSAIDDA